MGERLRDLDLLTVREGNPRRLLAVLEGGVNEEDVPGRRLPERRGHGRRMGIGVRRGIWHRALWGARREGQGPAGASGVDRLEGGRVGPGLAPERGEGPQLADDIRHDGEDAVDFSGGSPPREPAMSWLLMARA